MEVVYIVSYFMEVYGVFASETDADNYIDEVCECIETCPYTVEMWQIGTGV
jgi:hypothetical protein